MVAFMCLRAYHHGVGLHGEASGLSRMGKPQYFAFEVGTLDEALRAHGVPTTFELRRRVGAQIAVEFCDSGRPSA